MSPPSLGAWTKRRVATLVDRLTRSAPSSFVKDLVLGLLCRQPPEVLLDVMRELTAYVPESHLTGLLGDVASRFNELDQVITKLVDEGPPLASETALHVVSSSMRRGSSISCFRLWEQLRHVALHEQSTIDHVINVYTNTVRATEAHGQSLEGLHVLELGPGHSLLGGVLLLLMGAERYTAVDPFPVARVEPDLFQALLSRLQSPGVLTARSGSPAREEQRRLLERFEQVLTLGDESVEWDREILELLPVQAEHLTLPDGSVDLVVSNAVLEHVRDLDAVAEQCARVLKPGGLSLHQVDFRDHRDFDNPWEFLTFSPEAWEALLASTPFEYTNRRRHRDVLQAFESQGLERLQADVNCARDLPPEVFARLDAEFQAYEPSDLEALSALYVFRKPG